jgi:hypothetical protein
MTVLHKKRSNRARNKLRTLAEKVGRSRFFPQCKEKGRKFKGVRLRQNPYPINFAHHLFGGQAYHLPSLIKAPEMAAVICEIHQAFKKGIAPIVNPGGTSQSYLIKDSSGEYICIFKPFCVGFKEAVRELAAFRLDHDHFAGVPATVQTTLSHRALKGVRSGILQLYIDGVPLVNCDPHLIPSQIRRIAILDIRILNPDRHRSNLLYLPKTNKLVPIDHGSSLTTTPYIANFVWLSWKATHLPFSKKERDYIEAIDPIRDAHILKDELHFEEDNVVWFVIATHFLKEWAKRGYCASDIGKMVFREPGKKMPYSFPSLLENVHRKLQRKSFSGWESYSKMACDEVEKVLDQ